jgi:hypothetical protein
MFCPACLCSEREPGRCLCTTAVVEVHCASGVKIAIEGLISRYNRSMVIRQTNLLFISEGLAEELAAVGRVDLVLHIVATHCLTCSEGNPTDIDMPHGNRGLQNSRPYLY